MQIANVEQTNPFEVGTSFRLGGYFANAIQVVKQSFWLFYFQFFFDSERLLMDLWICFAREESMKTIKRLQVAIYTQNRYLKPSLDRQK